MIGKDRNSSWMGWVLLCCGLFFTALAVFRFVPDMRSALHESRVPGMDERLSSIKTDEISWLIEGRGGRWGRYGWYLAPNEHGSLRIRLPVQEAGTLMLRLWAYEAGHLSLSVSDGQTVHNVPADRLNGEFVRIGVNGPCELVVEASNDLVEDQLILDRFAATWSDSHDHLPSLLPFVGALVVCLFGWGWIVRQRNSPDAWRLWVGCTLILVAAITGWTQRWTLLEIARALPIDPDVVAYRAYAQSLQWLTPEHGFYSGTFSEREPMHVAAINLWCRLWGDTFPAIRWYTVVLSNLMVIATGAFVWTVSKKWTLGTAASWVMALSPAWIDESVRGLRLESESLLLLAILSVWVWARGWSGAVLLGGTIGFMTLERSTALSVTVPLIWIGWVVNIWRVHRGAIPFAPVQWRWSQLGLASGLAVMLFLPHLYGLYKVHGDLSWPTYGYARWLANVEFPERLGTEGFPSVEEFAQTPYAGPRITYTQYLFGLHTIPTLVVGQVKGWVESTIYMSVSATPHLKALIFLQQASGYRAMLRQISIPTVVVFVLSLGLTTIGWVILWRDSQFWWISFISIWGTWYTAYLYSARLIEPFRHTGHVYPLLLFCALCGGYNLYRYFMFRVSQVQSRISPLPWVGDSK